MSAPASEVRRVLLDAAELLRTKGWTQGAFALSPNGSFAHWSDPDANCFCAVGAIRAACIGMDHKLSAEEVSNAAQARAEDVVDGPLAGFNDAPSRTLAEVLAALAAAADLAGAP